MLKDHSKEITQSGRFQSCFVFFFILGEIMSYKTFMAISSEHGWYVGSRVLSLPPSPPLSSLSFPSLSSKSYVHYDCSISSLKNYVEAYGYGDVTVSFHNWMIIFLFGNIHCEEGI